MRITDFSFKGNRKYIHGPDILNNFYQEMKEEYGVYPETSSLMIRKMSFNQLDIHEHKLPNQPASCVFEAASNDNNVKYYLYESDQKVDRKRDYDENDIVIHAHIDPGQEMGMIRNYDRYSLSEISVAILKELCNSHIDHSVKWILVDILYICEVPLYTSEEIRVTLDKHIGTKMVVSSIYLNDQKVGRLKFSSR